MWRLIAYVSDGIVEHSVAMGDVVVGVHDGIMAAMKHITTIALDADDTLWGNEDIFVSAQKRYMELLAPYRSDWDAQELYDTEQRNLAYFGYGIKGFTLSMIETAIQITDGNVSGHDIGHIIAIAREMVHAPITLLPTVAETVAHWSTQYRLMVITKGDLFDQESKIARSGLAEYFRHVEVVSEKHPASYARILRRYDIAPQEFLMIGNSLRSDILPVLTIGATAVHVPYHLTWQHEHVEVTPAQRQWHEFPTLGAVAQWLAQFA